MDIQWLATPIEIFNYSDDLLGGFLKTLFSSHLSSFQYFFALTVNVLNEAGFGQQRNLDLETAILMEIAIHALHDRLKIGLVPCPFVCATDGAVHQVQLPA
jgi:hypothetical protein